MIWNLFLTFFKIGICTFGGGYAMLPILERECVDKNHWITNDEILDYYAIGQCTPGIIAVNVATFVGNKKKGLLGGLFATIGVVLPSILIITLFASVLFLYKDNVYVLKAFSGIRLSVCALILSSLFRLIKKSLSDCLYIFFALLSLLLQFVFSIDSIFIIISTLILGVFVFFLKQEVKK